jgi:hypothetical protein
MKRRVTILALVLVVGGVMVTSCTKEEPLSDKKEILSFIFEASKNVELDHNVLGVISGNTVTADVPFGTVTSGLIPTIEISPKAQLNPQTGVSMDFSSPVSFTVTAEDGTEKEFSASVAVEPAPYIGNWSSNAIDFGRGLMYIKVKINAQGVLQMELQEIISGELDNESIKGVFNPTEKPNREVKLDQTHRWVQGQWSELANTRTIMYEFEPNNKMRFYYCYCYPKVAWAFEVDLHKE